MAQLAIKGHATRGKEVIEILEMLGGNNPHEYVANSDYLGYYIEGKARNIHFGFVDNFDSKDVTIFTLEEFLEKFPYKVGDKVLYKTYGLYLKIKSMLWNKEKEKVFYRLNSNKLFVATADELQTCKE